jgi:FkbH-like protein
MNYFSDFLALRENLKSDIRHFPVIKVALVSDAATQFLETGIKGIGIERGFNIDLFVADFNQVERQLLDMNSELFQYNPEFVIIFQSTHKLLNKYNSISEASKSNLAIERIEFLESACKNLNSKVIILNYPEIDDSIFGSYHSKLQHSFLYQIRMLNYELMKLSQLYSNLYICDISSIQNIIGSEKMFDSSVYVTTEMVFSIESIPIISSRILDIISVMKGKFKKCIILDLDNTLWGGIIGDDGIENIQLGYEIGIGKAFTEFQCWIKKLKNRGIIIAICSKNNEETAKNPFLNHPDMILRLEDISVFIANWENKADNIRVIQSILNIGFDSMVFIDDNPFERKIVRDNIPEITVPEMPDDPAEYLETLYGLNLFETSSISKADSIRTEQYQIESKRLLLSKQFTNEIDFLNSLEMKCTVLPFNTFNIPRVAQLSQRSNQFNLRTVRYSEGDIENISRNINYQGFSFALEDNLGGHGLICCVILEKKDTEVLFIDSWFMSCRVLKRTMEVFTLNTIIDYANENGFSLIRGEYIPTAKNEIVANLFDSLGFVRVSNGEKQLFELDIKNHIKKENCIKIKHT